MNREVVHTTKWSGDPPGPVNPPLPYALDSYIEICTLSTLIYVRVYMSEATRYLVTHVPTGGR